MSSRTLPLLFINLGGEMLYILDQRLRAQNIPADKAKKGAELLAPRQQTAAKRSKRDTPRRIVCPSLYYLMSLMSRLGRRVLTIIGDTPPHPTPSRFDGHQREPPFGIWLSLQRVSFFFWIWLRNADRRLALPFDPHKCQLLQKPPASEVNGGIWRCQCGALIETGRPLLAGNGYLSPGALETGLWQLSGILPTPVAM